MTASDQSDPRQAPRRGDHLRALLPAGLCLVLSLVLPFFIFSHAPPQVKGMGPGDWPLVMLRAMTIFSALWLYQDLRAVVRGKRKPALATAGEAEGDEGAYPYPAALAGLALVVLYGMALVWLGFALASALFIVIWCYYAGLRDWRVVFPVALVGTVLLLWVFMGLAMMPLPRGAGLFDSFSIRLLQLLRIY